MRLRTILRYALASAIVLVAFAAAIALVAALFGAFGAGWAEMAAVLLVAPVVAYGLFRLIQITADEINERSGGDGA